MPKLIMTKGLPAAGKTSWSKEQLASSCGSTKRVNKDDLRAMIDNGKWSPANEKFVLRVRDKIIIEALASGNNIIVDDTNLDPKHEKQLRDIAGYCDSKFEIQDFTHVSLDECIKRDKARQASVGEKVIRDMWKRYLKPADPEPPPYDPNLVDCVIVDIDGTLAKMNGRGPFAWSRVGEDLPNEPVVNLVKMLLFMSKLVIFVSGRDSCCRKETEQWLKRYVGVNYPLFMRPAGDCRDDRIIKQEIYEKEIEGIHNVLYVLDDRNKVVEMWRSLGLTCLQVADGEF